MEMEGGRLLLNQFSMSAEVVKNATEARFEIIPNTVKYFTPGGHAEEPESSLVENKDILVYEDKYFIHIGVAGEQGSVLLK